MSLAKGQLRNVWPGQCEYPVWPRIVMVNGFQSSTLDSRGVFDDRWWSENWFKRDKFPWNFNSGCSSMLFSDFMYHLLDDTFEAF